MRRSPAASRQLPALRPPAPAASRQPPASSCGRRLQDGFTLIELMVVVIILGILAATIIPQFMGVVEDAKVTKAKTDIANLKAQLARYQLNMDRFPTTEEGLKSLVTPPSDAGKRWRGPYIEEMQADPWGNPYQYRCPGQNGRRFDIWSRGADNADGGEGINADILSWSQEAQ